MKGATARRLTALPAVWDMEARKQEVVDITCVSLQLGTTMLKELDDKATPTAVLIGAADLFVLLWRLGHRIDRDGFDDLINKALDKRGL